MDTSLKRTVALVPRVSALERVDCILNKGQICVFWIVRNLIFEPINWPPVKILLYFACPSDAEKVMQCFKATS